MDKSKGYHAYFINNADNVPYYRAYLTWASFRRAVAQIKHATFVKAIDYNNMRMVYPEDL